jgi:hypothetical protein
MTDRTRFNESWLSEQPMGIDPIDSYDGLVFNIKDLMRYGLKPVADGPGIMKIETSISIYYWFGTETTYDLIVEIEKTPQAYVARLIGKNPDLAKGPPYAADLYAHIADTAPLSVRFMSDTQMTGAAKKIWKNLFKNGRYITIYDRDQPGQTYKTFDNLNDFEDFFKHGDHYYKRYQYVLSRSNTIAEARSFFNTRRMRELCGFDLHD